MAVVFVVLGLAGALGLHVWAGSRARANQREAEAAFLAGDFQRARMFLEQAVQVNPRDLAARRALAAFYERANPPLALERWREAVGLEPEKDEARFGLAGCALRLGDAAEAREALAGVSEAGRATLAHQRLAAGLALLTDDRAGLERALVRIAQLEPGDLRARFNLATLRHTSRDPPAAAAGRAELFALARGGPLAIRATIALMRPGLNSPAPEVEWDRLARELLPGAAQSGPGRLALAEHLFAQPAPEAGDAAELVRWLGELGLATKALGWIDGREPVVRDAPEVRRAHADVAGRARDWKRLHMLVQDGAWGTISADAVTLAFAARAQREGAGVARALATWDDALGLARTRPAQQVLLRLAEVWIWPEATKATLWQMARSFPDESSAWRALLAGAEAEGDSPEAWETARAWAAARPADPAAQGRAQWLAVLLDKLDPALKAAARAALTAPLAAPESRAAGALLLLRAGQTAAALDALRPREAALAAAPRAALAYGRLLAAGGRTAEAGRWLDLAATVKLLPEERALLDQARASSAAARPVSP
jgi:hypothetical protein